MRAQNVEKRSSTVMSKELRLRRRRTKEIKTTRYADTFAQPELMQQVGGKSVDERGNGVDVRKQGGRSATPWEDLARTGDV